MHQIGKLEVIKIEMEGNNIDMIGLAETRWIDEDFITGEYRVK